MVSRSNIWSRKSTQQRRHRPKISTATLPTEVKTNANASVSEKLEALKQLLPAGNNGEIKVEQLFQETADYIVLLRTQVFILQKLLHFCDDIGQSQDNNHNNAL
ncbi:hypothetical protein A4A49_19017 [Nicotiana attenuata]|uniref:Uncharacterized protein n=1 Tax=Nicotiana attenuata TaxID=49451 RepID=A0A1J6JDP7_NICAT|nr:hypothetical protein A4A49_19017 [Nicotiana attenuata]